MDVVVTGGAGFIGANLVRHLRDTDGIDKLTVVDDLSTGDESNLDGVHGIRFAHGSVTNARVLDAAFDGAGAVVHLAAQPSVPESVAEPLATHDANVNGTLAVLEAARRAGGLHVVAASSSAVYGSSPVLPKTETMTPLPQSPYAASKLAAEGYLRAYHESYDLPVLPLRFFNVFGPLQPPEHAYAAVVPAFVSAALRGEPLTVHGDGLQTRDFVYVGSVVALLAEAVTRRVASPSPVNLAFGSRRTILDLVAELERVLERRLDVHHAAPRAGDVRHSQADDSRLRELFPGLEPVPFTEGLRETVEWFAASHVPTRDRLVG